MILSSQSIRNREILHPCYDRTEEGGLSYGLGPAGYDLRLDLGEKWRDANGDTMRLIPGKFALAAAYEHFNMPDDLIGRVCDKSSLARRGLSVFNTVIEPGWRGFLTLELVNQGQEIIVLRQGQGIAQVLFELLDQPTVLPYAGKYQDQSSGPQAARS